MALRSYEIMFLLDSGKYATDPDGVTAEIHGMLEKIGAEIVTARPWMDGKLAYPIEGHRKGLHYLTYVKADSNEVPKLQRMCRLSNVVLRYMCIVPPEQLFEPMSAALLDEHASHGHSEEEEGGSEEGEKNEKSEETTKEEAANA